MDPLYPAVPDDLSSLNDDELAQLEADSVAVSQRITENDPEFLGDRTAEQIITEMTAGVETIERIRAEKDTRAEAAAEYESRVAELASRVAPVAETEETESDEEPAETVEEPAETETEETETETETTDVVAEEEPLPIAAAARPVRRPLPRASRAHQPLELSGPISHLVASADIPDLGGSEIDALGLAKAMVAASSLSVSAPEGFMQKAIVASAKFTFPEDRILDPNDTGQRNEDKIKAVVGEQALVASGGLCAPVTPIYDLPVISVADRPVRDALPSFQAVRGGVNLPTPLTLGDITTGAGYITEANDAAGGSAATKACQTIPCHPYTPTFVNAVYHCMKFGNLGAKAWPELVASFNEYLMAAWARLAETKLLDGIAAGSTAVTGAQYNGAINSLVGHILEAAAGIRSFNRMRDGAVLRAIFPAWVKDLLVLDIARSQFQRFAYDRDGVEQLFAMYDIAASFTLDGPTGGNQVFGAQSAGAINGFPSNMIWYLFPEGTWLFLDSGTLELGIVRDSTLNSTNDFENFGESWENVAKVGPVSYQVTSTLCANGVVSAPAAPTGC